MMDAWALGTRLKHVVRNMLSIAGISHDRAIFHGRGASSPGPCAIPAAAPDGVSLGIVMRGAVDTEPTQFLHDKAGVTGSADVLHGKGWTMTRTVLHLALATATAASVSGLAFLGAKAADSNIDRGKYLASVTCAMCHTPGYFLGKPDPTRYLGGSEVGVEIKGGRVVHAPNLTPDQETGLGTWTTEQIVAAIQTGTRPDGRVLAGAMPWHLYANLTKSDATAIAVFLQSLPPVKNKVPGRSARTKGRRRS
jgi:mono/diheme cytochrome c family protein